MNSVLLSLISVFTTIVDKSPCDSNAVFIFSAISGFPHKKVFPFRNFLERSPPPPPTPYTKLKLGTNSGYTRQSLFVGWRDGLGLGELGNASDMQKCPKTFGFDFWVGDFYASYSSVLNRFCNNYFSRKLLGKITEIWAIRTHYINLCYEDKFYLCNPITSVI